MSGRPAYDDVAIGAELPSQEFQLRRVNLVRYAGASGDFNPIHWNERFARSVGLPDVIAHGMMTMAQAIRVVTDWAGDPGAVIDYGVRFTRPVVVPDDDHGATLRVGGRVIERLEDRCVRVELTASSAAPGQEGDGPRVLGRAHAVVRLL